MGTNGAGKTSALNLISIFYGKDPASLMVQAADKKNFSDYHLPNEQALDLDAWRVHVLGVGLCPDAFTKHAAESALLAR